MYCAYCGKKIEKASSFCGYCGKKKHEEIHENKIEKEIIISKENRLTPILNDTIVVSITFGIVCISILSIYLLSTLL